jgi:hypothetical protein
MAQVFPLNDDGATRDDARLTLAGTLASLPQEWTALRDRSLDEDVVDAVLVHPEMGVALVSLAPIAPEAAAAILRGRLEHEHFGEFFPGTLPIVVLGTTPLDIPEIEKRLADAFQQAPKLAITDGDWADAVVELLLESSDLKMAPVQFAASPREPLEPLGSSNPEAERVAPAPPSFSGTRTLGLQADNGAVPPAPAPRRIDSLIVAACAVVFVAELGVAFCSIEVGALLPFSTPLVVRSETPTRDALEVAKGGVARPPPAPEGLLAASAATLIDPSPEAPTQTAAAVSQPKLTDGGASRAGKSRYQRTIASHRATVNSGERYAGKHRDQYALANEIYRPGSRPSGW